MVVGDEIGVVRFRTEGEFYNAYYARTDKEPIFLGGIAKILIESQGSDLRKLRFMSLIQDCVAHVLLTKFGIEVVAGAPVPIEETKEITDAHAEDL